MPVKVRCSSCSKVLNAPDAARGKAVKCPGCGERVRVPAEKSPAGKAVTAGGSEDVFAKLDLSKAEDRNVQVCVKCGTEVTAETLECPKCGVNPHTGVMSERVARKKARKGPDPDRYYAETFSDAWSFACANWTLALRSTMYWAVMLITGVASVAFAAYVHTRWGKPPVVVFFASMGLLLLVGFPGWMWSMWTTIINRTLSREKKMERVHFDIFTVIALGIKYVMWTMVNALWLAPITVPLALVMGGPMAPMIGAIAGLVSLFSWPVLMAHMSMPVQWKGWVSPLMWKIFFKNFVPAMYWWAMALAVLVVNVVVGAALGFLFRQFAASIVQALGIAVQQNLIPGTPQEISKTLAGVMLGVIILLWLVQLFVTAFSYICLMRANGQFVYYFKSNLELISEEKAVVFVRKTDEFGQPLKKGFGGGQALVGIGATLAFYIALNVVVYFSTGGKYLILPRPIAVAVTAWMGLNGGGGPPAAPAANPGADGVEPAAAEEAPPP